MFGKETHKISTIPLATVKLSAMTMKLNQYSYWLLIIFTINLSDTLLCQGEMYCAKWMGVFDQWRI